MTGVFFEVVFLLLASYIAWMLLIGRAWRLLPIVLLLVAAAVLSTYQGSLVFAKIEFRSAFVFQNFAFHSLEALVLLCLTWLIDRGIEALQGSSKSASSFAAVDGTALGDQVVDEPQKKKREAP